MSANSLHVSELRLLSDEELQKRLGELKQEHFNLRFQHHTGQLENFMQIRNVKRNIAKVKTVLVEKK